MIRSALLLSLCLFGWSAESTLAGLAEYRISQGQRGLASIRQDIFRADPAQSSAWEARLLDILRRPDLSVEARNETCRLLLPVASAACIPAMAPLLGDPATTVASRHVLLALEARLVVPVLRQATLTANGLVQAGLLGDLGQRHDVASIPAMADLAQHHDPVLAKAGIAALRLTGGAQATQALAALAPRPEVRPERDAALAILALDLARNGQAAPAMAALAALTEPMAPAVRGLVWQVRALTDSQGLVRELIPRLGTAIGEEAAEELVGIVDSGVETALIQALPGLDPMAQIQAVHVLARRRSPAAAPDVARLTDSTRPAALRLAAITALEDLAGPAQVDLLIRLGVDADPACAAAARHALASGPHPGLTAAIEQRWIAGGSELVVVQAAAERRIPGAIAALVPLAIQGSEPARETLGRLGGLQELEALVGALDGSDGLERVVAKMLKPLPDRLKAVAALTTSAQRHPGAPRRSALRLLGLCGGPAAVAVVVGHLQQGDPEDTGAALDVLARWSGLEALTPLLDLASTTTETSRRSLALQGVARLTELPGQTPAERVSTLRLALAASREADERKRLYAAVARIPSAEAVELLRRGLTDPLVQAEAAAAWVTIARTLAGTRQIPAARQVLEELAAATTGDLHQRAKDELAALGDKP